jgi:hypothetical protein
MFVHRLGKSSRYGRDNLIEIYREGDRTPGRSLKVSFQRTVRVSDNGSTNHLPPSFGTFPLYTTSDYEKSYTLPEAMKAKGGYFLPMHH